MNKIVFKDIIRHHDLSFAQRVYPSVFFSNKIMDDAEILAATEVFIKPILDKCLKEQDIDDTIFTDKLVAEYIAQLPKDLLADVTDITDAVGFWLSYSMGCICSNLTDVQDISALLLHMFFSFDGRGFVYGYVPQEEHIKCLMANTDFSTFRLLKRNRLVQDYDEVTGYTEYYQSMSDEDFLTEVSKDAFYNDFRPLPDDCILLSKCLIQAGMYGEWGAFFNAVEIPFLQIELFAGIQEPSVVLQLLKEHSKVQTKRSKAYRRVFMNVWSKMLVREQELYIKPLPIDYYEEEVVKTFSELISESTTEIKSLCNEGISAFVEICGYAEVSEWLFSKSLKDNEIYEANRAYNSVLRNLQEIVANNAPEDSYALDARDLHYLAYIAGQFVVKGIVDERRDSLLSNIWAFIKSKDFYWPSSLETQYLKDMRTIASLISMYPDPSYITSVIDAFRVKYEGINSDHMKVWNKKAIRECYVYSCLLFILEHESIETEHKERLFQIITDQLIRQVYFCGMDLIVESEYQIPLIVAEVIADQILPGCKDSFEQTMCTHVYEKHVVLKVLSFSKAKISSAAREAVEKFRDTDWKIIRQDYLHRHMTAKAKEIESLFARVGI